MNRLVAMYSPRIVTILTYMLQTSEYHVGEYLTWVNRTRNFSSVINRKKLVFTNKALGMMFAGFLIYALLLALAVWGMWRGGLTMILGIVAIVALPYLVAYAITLPLVIGQILIQRPREKKMVEEASELLRRQHCRKIAIAGSYGKTTFKEMLAVILSQSLHVAASPGNMNTPLGIARFARKLDRSEDVLIFELGEEVVGDVKRLCDLTRPNMGVITGISSAHINSFGSIENVTKTVFELSDYLKSYDVYKNGESELVASQVSPHDKHVYGEKGVNSWKISDVKVGLNGTEFVASKKGKTVWANSKLLGRHQIGPLVACIDIADKLGMNVSDIAKGIKATAPFEHRMQPLNIHGAVVIDDTYNGNPKGIEAGLRFLDEIDARRKIFVTPGLVEQGDDSDKIHENIGKQAAKVCDIVVMMSNSTTEAIVRGLNNEGFKGSLRIEKNPVEFYTNLGQFVASGDVVLMQNDWSDNYS